MLLEKETLSLQLHEMIPFRSGRRHPLTAQPQYPARVRPFRQRDLDGTGYSCDPHLGPGQHLAGRHGERRADIVAFAVEDRMRPDVDLHQRVAGLTAAKARMSLLSTPTRIVISSVLPSATRFLAPFMASANSTENV